MRRSLDALRQSFPNLIPVYVQTARPTAAWPTNGSVYQYTRFDTLRSMLGGAVIDTSTPPQPLRSLWATSSFHMNDSQEFVRGKDLLRMRAIVVGIGPGGRITIGRDDRDAGSHAARVGRGGRIEAGSRFRSG